MSKKQIGKEKITKPLEDKNKAPEKINYYDLKVCSVSKALSLASELMVKNQCFNIVFVKKQDESTHELEHTCFPVEYKVDEQGKKWKRVYE